ncbi:MAG: hypothetical protein KDK23_05960 [Leptospiraceae bacterium]|nr:hypothetical protein [Leptospiraceae bacterium]
MFLKPYQTLLADLGPSQWWPGQSSFEIMVGAILTQNTSWKNVEKAIHTLKKDGALRPAHMHSLAVQTLAQRIRSSGYFNQKARTLMSYLDWYRDYGYSPALILKRHNHDASAIRAEMLSIRGIGPETADSILCYALQLPVFVVDAYTHRWIARYDPAAARASSGKYHLLQEMVEQEFRERFPARELTEHFNEFHALMVRLGNGYCKKKDPLCPNCPLKHECEKSLA